MIMRLENVNYIYNPNTPFEKRALDGINLNIKKGDFIGLIGHTGSGKSTLVQHLNGLMKPTSGKILVDGTDITSKDADLTGLRQKVGLVFQYPEHQLFEETIYKDIAFGPKNLKLDDKQVHERVKRSMELVGLDYDSLKDRSPFELSGGQKRRVAIAGVLAMKPGVLVLDEPTAGLDPRGRDEIFSRIQEIYQEEGITIILVSHSMEDVAKLVKTLVVMHKGRIAMEGKSRDIFRQGEKLEKCGLGIPEITRFMKAFKEKGNSINEDILTVEEAKAEMINYLRSRGNA